MDGVYEVVVDGVYEVVVEGVYEVVVDEEVEVRPGEDRREPKELLDKLDKLDSLDPKVEVVPVEVYLEASADADVVGVYLDPREEAVDPNLEPVEVVNLEPREEVEVVVGVYLDPREDVIPLDPKEEYDACEDAGVEYLDPNEKDCASVSAAIATRTIRAAQIFIFDSWQPTQVM